MKTYLKPLLALFLFLLIQGVVSIFVVLVASMLSSEVVDAASAGDAAAISEAAGKIAVSPNVLSLSLILSSLASCVIMVWPLKMFLLKREFTPSGVGFNLVAIAVIGTIFGIFGTDFISEVLDLPNIIEAQLNGMSATVLGALAISVFGPIAEEFVFRGAIMGYMLRKGVAPWAVIIFSAFLFGLMHINPAQVPFAMIVGIFLGVIYYRTGNILLTSAIHILNNSFATMMANVASEDAKMADLVGGSATASIVVGVVGLAASYFILSYFWKHTKDIEYVEKKDLEPVVEE